MTDLQLLVTGDLHLGRHPTRVPEELDGQQFSPAAVWLSTVEAAIERDVDAVLVAGDVVDRENRYVEAYGDFEQGARRLAEASIPLVAVAGNHDHDALPELVDSLDGVDLLGADGTWERRAIRRDGEPVCYVDGWSFPSEHVLANPLDDYEPGALATAEVDPGGPAGDGDASTDRDDAAPTSRTDAPVIGLLHADLDARDSDYAPVETADLRDERAAAWVLGHVHAPGVRVDADPLVLYPGSPQPLDPGEPGAHGPWLLTVDASGRRARDLDVEQLPLATLRYDEVDVDASDVDAATEATPTIRERLEGHLRRGDVATSELELLLARVRLTGRTAAHGDLADEAATLESQLELRRAGTAVRVPSLEVATRPAVDLASLAGDDTPAAYLAELLLALEGEDAGDGDDAEDAGGDDAEDAGGDDAEDAGGDDAEDTGVGDATAPVGDGTGRADDATLADEHATLNDDHAALVDDALDRLREAYGARAYSRLHREERIDQPDRADAVETLQRQARLLLDQLLQQREEAR